MGETLQQMLQRISELAAQAEIAKRNSEGFASQAGQKMIELRKRIKLGESTGDRIKDYVLMRYYCANDEIETTLRNLDKRLREHPGEFVLVVVQEEQRYGVIGIMPGTDTFQNYHVVERLHLGVLRGGGLGFNLETLTCSLSIERYAYCWNLHSEEVTIVPLDFEDSFPSDFGRQLNKPLKRKGTYKCWLDNPFQKEELVLEVKVGDQEVGAWFEQQSKKRYLVIFKKMAGVLDKPVPETQALREELDSRRGAVRERLAKLETAADNHQAKINHVYKSKSSGTYSEDGISVTVCETNDDAFWISLTDRQGLKEVIKNIQSTLATAVELGMENEELVQRISKKYEQKPG